MEEERNDVGEAPTTLKGGVRGENRKVLTFNTLLDHKNVSLLVLGFVHIQLSVHNNFYGSEGVAKNQVFFIPNHFPFLNSTSALISFYIRNQAIMKIENVQIKTKMLVPTGLRINLSCK